MSDDNQHEGSRFQASPTGPRVAPPRGLGSVPPPPQPRHAARFRPSFLSVIVFVLLISGVGIRAYRDLSQPEAWAYWKDQYFSPSLTSSVIPKTDLGGRPALAVRGPIGPAAATWFREHVDEAHLVAGDAVLLSSPGGDLGQAVIMGEFIRSRGLVTAVGIADASGRIQPSYCASACVFVYAGGKSRYGVQGSGLGVHRFVATKLAGDPVAEAQRVTGAVLSYMTRMGVSPSIVEAMSQTSDIRWLGPRETTAMNLVTAPSRAP